MIRKLTLLSFVAVAACAVPIPVQTPVPAPVIAPQPAPIPGSAKERFVQAAEANGCEVNKQNSAAILTDATLSVDDLARIMTELKTEGRGEIAADGQSFRITTGVCA